MLLRLIEMYGSTGSVASGRMSRLAETKCLDVCWGYCEPHSKRSDADHERSMTWDIHESENHHVQRFSTTWHFAKLAMNDPDYRDLHYEDGGTPADHYRAWTEYTEVYCQERARKGLFVEMHNASYNGVLFKGLYNCYDFGEEPLRRRVGQLLDLYWATWAQEQMDGVEGGGRSRVYQGPGSLTDHGNPMMWLHFARGNRNVLPSSMLSAALSDYRLPLVVMDIALDIEGRGVYEVHQRPLGLSVPGHKGNTPYRAQTEHGGIHRYTYCTPEFMIGTPMVEAREREDWMAISSQNRWEGVIFPGNSESRIVPQVEAENESVCYNGPWSVQKKGTLISQKLRTSAGGGSMRVWISEAGLSEPETIDTWTLAEHKEAYAAIRPVRGGFSWDIVKAGNITFGGHSGLAKTTKDHPGGRWLILEDEWSPVIIEVARKSDYPDLDAFQAALSECTIAFEGETLTYKGLSGDEFTFDLSQTDSPTISGKPVDYAPSKAFQSPFVDGDWTAGVIHIQKDDREMVLDFNA
jgi:hypothetical protein